MPGHRHRVTTQVPSMGYTPAPTSMPTTKQYLKPQTAAGTDGNFREIGVALLCVILFEIFMLLLGIVFCVLAARKIYKSWTSHRNRDDTLTQEALGSDHDQDNETTSCVFPNETTSCVSSTITDEGSSKPLRKWVKRSFSWGVCGALSSTSSVEIVESLPHGTGGPDRAITQPNSSAVDGAGGCCNHICRRTRDRGEVVKVETKREIYHEMVCVQ